MPPQRRSSSRRRPRQSGRKSKQTTIEAPNQLSVHEDNPRRILNFTGDKRRSDPIIKISQWVDYGQLASSSTVNVFGAQSTVFTDLPDNANYSGAFDQYRITMIEYFVKPTCQKGTSNAATSPYAFMYFIHDYDDATSPSSLSALLSYSNVTIIGPGESHARKIRPHCATAMTTSAAGAITGAQNQASPWLDSSSTSVVHYGIKYGITQGNSTNLTTWRLFARIHCELRNQK